MKMKVFKIGLFLFLLSGSSQMWSQVEPSATGGVYDPDSQTRMMMPPPVSGQSFPTTVGSQERSNYLSGGMAFTAAYTDNLLNIQSPTPVSDETYAIFPNMSIQRKTARQIQSLRYGVGYTIYQHTSDLNDFTQNADADYAFRMTKYSTISFHDSFNQNSNSFNNPNPSGGAAVSGSSQSPIPGLLVPFQSQLSNSIRGGVAVQYARNSMIGGGGSYSFLNYGNDSNQQQINDSDTTGGSAFYNRRIGQRNYLGAIYSYSRFNTHPVNSTIDTHAILGFFTIYLSQTVSISLSGGPQHFNSDQPPYPSDSSWTPAIGGSVGWQTPRANLAVSYMRMVTSGGGLAGAFYSQTAALSLRWLLTGRWSIGGNGSYYNYRNATPIYTSSNQGGHTLSGGISLQHQITENLSAELGYSHFTQSYGSIASISKSPDSNRVYGSVNYQFSKPLGR